MKTNYPICALLMAALVTASCNADSQNASGTNSGVNGTGVANEHVNILFIMADDLGFGDVGYNTSRIETPALDSLAEGGLTLDQYYAYPICSPTRAALMTGRSAITIGVDMPFGIGEGLPLDEKLLPEMLQEAGYQTLMVGKWHLGGHDVRYFPHNRGFDYYYGNLEGGVDYYSHVTSLSDSVDWQRNGSTVMEDGYTTDLLTDDAVRLLKEVDRDQPFFLYLAYTAPHTPLQAPPGKIIDHYADVEDENRRIYAAMVEALDSSIARVTNTLEEEGLSENTLVIFVSDNGGSERAGADNGILRSGKGQIFQGGIRVPGLVYWPGRIEAGINHSNIYVHDWLPTLMAAVGLEPEGGKPIQGKNMWPAIQENLTVRPEGVVMGVRSDRAVFKDNWKLVDAAKRGSRDRQLLLFDLDNDPEEQTDLSASHPQVVSELSQILAEFPVGKSLIAPMPERPEADDLRDENGYLMAVEPPLAETATGQ